MFALDLFNTKYEKELNEGAVDNLEARRIDDLNEKMQELLSRAKNASPEMKAGLKREFDKVKAERDSYFKIKDECMGYGSLGEQGLPDVADKQAKMARLNQPGKVGSDVVTPQQRVAGATMPSNTALGKAKETFTSFANWIAGKDDTGPTYESATTSTSAITAAKYAYEQMRKAHDDNVDIATIQWMGNPQPITMSRNQLYHTLTKLKSMSRQNRNQFALQTLANRNNFALWLGGQKKVSPRPQLKQPSDPFQPELPLGKPQVSERTQKKNSENDTYGDVEVARNIQKIRAKHPAARSDIEALAKDELEHTKRSDQQLAAIKGANTDQDALLRQLVALDKKQGAELDQLDSENDSQERELERIQSTNANLQKTIQAMTGTKQSARPKQTAKVEPQPNTPGSNVEKQLQGLEAQIQSLQTQPRSPEIDQKIEKLQNQINSLPAKAAQALNIEPVVQPKQVKQASRVQAPFGDLDINPKQKTSSAKPKAKTQKTQPDDEFDLLNIDESANKLHQGDPIVVTGPNEFEGKTGEIYDFSPSGSFVIVDLYNHGKHSMHLSDITYNEYADQEQDEEDDWYDDMDESTMSELDAMRQDLERMNDRQFLSAYGMSKQAFQQKYRTVLNPAQAQDTPVLDRTRFEKHTPKKNEFNIGEGFQDFNKVEPYAVCLAGKPVKQFDYYEEARRFHDNWKKKLYNAGDKEKADKITLMPLNLDEAMNKNDLLGNVAKDLNTQFKKAKAGKLKASGDFTKGDHWQGAKPGDYGYTGYQGHGMPTDKAERDRIRADKKKGVAEGTGPQSKLDQKIIHLLTNGIPADAIARKLDIPVAWVDEVAEYNMPDSAIDYNDPRNTPPTNRFGEGVAEVYTPSPAKPFRNPPGFNKQGTGLGNKLADLNRAELANIQPSKGTPVPGKEFAQGVLKDLKKVNVKEAEGSWIVYDPETKQIKKRFKTHTAGKSYAKTHGLGFASSEYYFDNIKEKEVAENDDWDDGEWEDAPDTHAVVKAKQPAQYPEEVLRAIERNPAMRADIIADYKRKQEVGEAQTDYQKRRQRERDVDAGRPVKALPKNPQTDYARKRAKDRKDMELGEDSSTGSEAAERAILNRIMVAHTDLLKQFGPQKVMQAAEEVAYNVGDVDEIGTSDVSGWVNQVKQILGT